MFFHKSKTPILLLSRSFNFSQKLSSHSQDYYLIRKNDMEDFMQRCMLAVGTKKYHAESLAKCLIDADYRGHFSHGLNRLDMYVRDIKAGTTFSDREPKIAKETVATALVDGNNVLGPVVGNFCMQLAIEKAKQIGIGMVVANRSNHYGIAAHYSIQALKEKLIGLSFTNTSPLIYPTRSKQRTFGTNPLSVAAPGKGDDKFVLDMATSTVAFGKVEISNLKGEKIPSSWGADKNGQSTCDPEQVINGGGLLPLGGSEESSGYKGYGLNVMVEILCGILGGSLYGPHIRTWQTSSGEADLGQCFMAINPRNFADNFEDRLQDLINYCRNMTPIEPNKPVMVAGDPEENHMKMCDERDGIGYHVNQVKYAEDLANELNIQGPPKRSFLL